MRAVPVPGVFDDSFEFWELSLPAKLPDCLLARCNESRRIAGPAGRFGGGDCASRNFPARFDNLSHGETFAIAEVEDLDLARLDSIYCQYVGVGKVADVNIIADARAVRR